VPVEFAVAVSGGAVGALAFSARAFRIGSYFAFSAAAAGVEIL
jgi:hypothetical protein